MTVREIIQEQLNQFYCVHHDKDQLVNDMELYLLRHIESLLAEQVEPIKPYRIMEIKGGFINE